MIIRFRGTRRIEKEEQLLQFASNWNTNRLLLSFTEDQVKEKDHRLRIENLIFTMDYQYVDQICCGFKLVQIPSYFHYIGLSAKYGHVYQKWLVTAFLTGGLGNRLFQMSAAYWYATKNNATAVIADNMQDDNQHSKINYTITLFQHFPLVTHFPHSPESRVTIFQEKEEDFSTFRDWPLQPNINVILKGYFQSVHYIQPNFARMINVLPHNPSNHVFLHVRRGDFVKNDFHFISLIAYYIAAIRRKLSSSNNNNVNSEEDTKLLICSNDITYCKHQWYLNQYHKNILQYDDELENELQTFSRMVACRGGGICSNSTFSWWAAYIGKSNTYSYIPNKWLNNHWKTELTIPLKLIELDVASWFIDFVYINLEHREDRKEMCLIDLRDKLGVPDSHLQRFNAVFVPKNGHLGCCASHLHVLQQFLTEWVWMPLIAIVEDDFKLKSSIEHLLNFLNNIAEFDGILLGGGCIKSQDVPDARNAKKLICSQQTVGYVVTRQGAQSLVDLWSQGRMSLADTTKQQFEHVIDQSWKKLHEKGKWFIVEPFMCEQRPSYSDIEKRIK